MTGDKREELKNSKDEKKSKDEKVKEKNSKEKEELKRKEEEENLRLYREQLEKNRKIIVAEAKDIYKDYLEQKKRYGTIIDRGVKDDLHERPQSSWIDKENKEKKEKESKNNEDVEKNNESNNHEEESKNNESNSKETPPVNDLIKVKDHKKMHRIKKDIKKVPDKIKHDPLEQLTKLENSPTAEMFNSAHLHEEMQHKYVEFANNYPLVLRYMVEHDMFHYDAFEKYLSLLNNNKESKAKDEKWLKSQADYIKLLYRKLYPKQYGPQQLSEIWTHTYESLKKEIEKFKTQHKEEESNFEEKEKEKINMHRADLKKFLLSKRDEVIANETSEEKEIREKYEAGRKKVINMQKKHETLVKEVVEKYKKLNETVDEEGPTDDQIKKYTKPNLEGLSNLEIVKTGLAHEQQCELADVRTNYYKETNYKYEPWLPPQNNKYEFYKKDTIVCVGGIYDKDGNIKEGANPGTLFIALQDNSRDVWSKYWKLYDPIDEKNN